MATDNTDKQRRKHPDNYRTCVVHARLTPAEHERLRYHSRRLYRSMGSILATGGLEAAERMEAPKDRPAIEYEPRYELTESDQIVMDVRRKIREEELNNESWEG